jgi:hypothetical protein
MIPGLERSHPAGFAGLENCRRLSHPLAYPHENSRGCRACGV